MKIVSCMVGLFVSVSFGAVFTSPANAQSNPDIQVGSKIPVRPAKANPVADGQVRDLYIRCAYGPNRKEIDELLKISDPMTVDFEGAGMDDTKMFRRWGLRQCFVAEGETVQSEISFSPEAFRYIMLEGAYLRAHPEIPANAEAWVAKPRDYVSTGDSLKSAMALGALSDCMIAQDPEAADQLVRTASGTDKEKEAAMDLVPALSACMTVGQQLELTPANLRSFAADGLWQRYVAGGPSASVAVPTGDIESGDTE